jgi:hypothetical protein
MTHAVTVNDPGQLPVSECLRLLRSTRLARVVVSADGQLEVIPVIFSIQGDTITFRATEDSLVSTVFGSPVLFEADGLHGEVAWRVTVLGLVRSVDESCQVTQLRMITLTPRSIAGDRFAFDDSAAWGWW